MVTTEANPFGSVTVQPWLATTTSESAVRAPERLLHSESVFVLPKQEAPRPNTQNSQPNPLILFSNALGFSNVANYIFGNRVGTSSSTTNKPGGDSLVDDAGWDADIDPLTGEPRVLSPYRSLSTFLDNQDSPFTRSLDILF